jgi:hypothetical protein
MSDIVYAARMASKVLDADCMLVSGGLITIVIGNKTYTFALDELSDPMESFAAMKRGTGIIRVGWDQ